jgi:hypothetical protein
VFPVYLCDSLSPQDTVSNVMIGLSIPGDFALSNEHSLQFESLVNRQIKLDSESSLRGQLRMVVA